MFETVVALLFLLALWAIGRAILIAVRVDADSWLAMPVGLSAAGLVGNALYFAAGLSVHTIQWVLLGVVVSCVLFVLRRRLPRFEWGQLLAICGLFLVLALPAYVGGEQYYVFRGNHWDHFNYINQSLTILGNQYAAYVNAGPAQFLATDVLAHGLPFVGLRPAVALVFALMLPGKTGNLHLLAFLYVTVLMSLIFPASCFAWGRIFQGYGRADRSVGLALVLSAAYVVGFWGQYLFDINAWSQMSAVSMLLGFVFAYARLLQRLTAAPQTGVTAFLPDVLLAMVLAAGAFLFYPENTVAHLVMLSVGTVSLVRAQTTPARAAGSDGVCGAAYGCARAVIASVLGGDRRLRRQTVRPRGRARPGTLVEVLRQLLAGAAGQPTGRRRLWRMPARHSQSCAGRGRNVFPVAELCSDANRAVRVDRCHDAAGPGDDLQPVGVVVGAAFRERHGGVPGDGCHWRTAVRSLLPGPGCVMERGEAPHLRVALPVHGVVPSPGRACAGAAKGPWACVAAGHVAQPRRGRRARLRAIWVWRCAGLDSARPARNRLRQRHISLHPGRDDEIRHRVAGRFADACGMSAAYTSWATRTLLSRVPQAEARICTRTLFFAGAGPVPSRDR